MSAPPNDKGASAAPLEELVALDSEVNHIAARTAELSADMRDRFAGVEQRMVKVEERLGGVEQSSALLTNAVKFWGRIVSGIMIGGGVLLAGAVGHLLTQGIKP